MLAVAGDLLDSMTNQLEVKNWWDKMLAQGVTTDD
jgi:hypothetical protein